MNFFLPILSFFAMLAVIIIAWLLCKKYVFNTVRINKWIPLSISVILLLIQMFFKEMNQYLSIGLTIFAVLFFLWFIEISQNGGPKKKEKQIVIKPKAKPNRVKNKK